MSINIPQSVYDKYYEVVDSTFDIFGVTCKLVSIDKKEEIIYNPNNNLPINNSINDHRRGTGDRNRGTVTIKEVESYEEIKLKVYWDSKQWIQINGGIIAPDASIQTIGFMEDLPKVLKAKQLLVHKDIEQIKEMRFERVGEYIPLGIKQIRYFACFWKRSS